jgi:hypothetical protein
VARGDASFESQDEAIDARLGDGSLFTTPRSVLEEEADMHLVRGSDSRWRWRYSAAAAVVTSTRPPRRWRGFSVRRKAVPYRTASAATSRSYAGSVRNSTNSGSVAIRSKISRAGS